MESKLKLFGIFLIVALMSACTPSQPPESSPTATQSPASTILVTTPTRIPSTLIPIHQEKPCIPGPKIDSFALQSVYPADLTKFGIDMRSVIDPVLSPNDEYLALTLYEPGPIEDKGTGRLAILNKKSRTVTWLLEYQALDRTEMSIAWSPDSQWVAFIPWNVAYGDDSGLWIFDITGTIKHHERRGMSTYGWDEDSQKVYFQFKDVFGYVDVTTWEVVGGLGCH